jgi:hypothetical protein
MVKARATASPPREIAGAFFGGQFTRAPSPLRTGSPGTVGWRRNLGRVAPPPCRTRRASRFVARGYEPAASKLRRSSGDLSRALAFQADCCIRSHKRANDSSAVPPSATNCRSEMSPDACHLPDSSQASWRGFPHAVTSSDSVGVYNASCSNSTANPAFLLLPYHICSASRLRILKCSLRAYTASSSVLCVKPADFNSRASSNGSMISLFARVYRSRVAAALAWSSNPEPNPAFSCFLWLGHRSIATTPCIRRPRLL